MQLSKGPAVVKCESPKAGIPCSKFDPYTFQNMVSERAVFYMSWISKDLAVAMYRSYRSGCSSAIQHSAQTAFIKVYTQVHTKNSNYFLY